MILHCSWLCWCVFVIQCLAKTDFGSDTIYQGQQLRDSEVMSSANRTFTLQFFNHGISDKRYLGIFTYLCRENQPVWIANLEDSYYDDSGILMINGTDGMLNIIHSGGTISFPTTSGASYRNINTSATLREDGNLVLRQVYPNGSIGGTILWQSFDYPTDTLLPGMKLGINLKTGHQWSLTSWKSDESLSFGSFTLGVDRNSTNQLIILLHGKVFWTSGLLQNGTLENSTPYVDSPIHFKYISNQNEKYFTYSQTTDGRFEVLRLTPDGKLISIRHNPSDKAMNRWRMWLISSVGATLLLLINIVFIRRNQREKAKRKETERLGHHELVDRTTPLGEHTTANETSKMGPVHLFKFETIEMATNKFSTENKLGEGGFGQVYKGKLLDGQSVAVKRLSRSSNQGIVQFKNEIQLIAKLQHNNLVRLLGCCIHREDMMLVYEYMPNKSLDYFLFDPTKRALLQWTNRVNIIEGIAQGLEYLHKHSRLRVIHRDIKANNILLDQNMTPKISDFGIARISGAQDSQANTKTIIGTHGYMSPEYAINGVVSTKLDVFSFGVLILEIVSGKKNHKCYHSERPLNLVGLAWELWIEGREQDLVDATMNVSNHLNEVQRCIYIGLLCVQDNAANRPSMTDVILLLKNESLPLPIPKQPGFFIHVCTVDKDKEERLHKNCSNDLSTSVLEPR